MNTLVNCQFIYQRYLRYVTLFTVMNETKFMAVGPPQGPMVLCVPT